MSTRIPSANLSVALPITGQAMLVFEVVWPELEPSISCAAGMITNDPDDQRDLIQEAMITFWNSDATRYDFRHASDLAYMRRVLINRMRDVWGRSWRTQAELDDARTLDMAALAEQLGRVRV